jgi:hypothetical protein
MTENKEQPKENNKPTIIIMASAAGLYAAVKFWYISIPVLIVAGVIFYMAYKKNPKLQAQVKGKFGRLWTKLKKFMQR